MSRSGKLVEAKEKCRRQLAELLVEQKKADRLAARLVADSPWRTGDRSEAAAAPGQGDSRGSADIWRPSQGSCAGYWSCSPGSGSSSSAESWQGKGNSGSWAGSDFWWPTTGQKGWGKSSWTDRGKGKFKGKAKGKSKGKNKGKGKGKHKSKFKSKP